MRIKIEEQRRAAAEGSIDSRENKGAGVGIGRRRERAARQPTEIIAAKTECKQRRAGSNRIENTGIKAARE